MSTPFDSVVSGPLSNQETMSDPDSLQNSEHRSQSDSNETGTSPEDFYGQIAPQALRYAMSIVRKWADAEEIVQEAFCRLIQSDANHPTDPIDLTPTTLNNSHRKSRLFAIVRNLGIDQLRTHGRRRFEPIDTLQIANTKTPTDETRLQHLENVIQQSLKEMPNQWSEALQLKLNGELSYAEISDVLESTHAQVRTWIYRARKQLESDLVHQGILGDQSDE